MEGLVAVPVVLRGGDHRDDLKAGRLEDRHRALEGRPRVPSVLVVVGQREPTPVRLADDDLAARPHRRRERLDGLREAAVDEARAEAERGVVGLRLERRGSAVAQLERQPLCEPGCVGSRHRDGVELRRDLDSPNAASERLPEDERRPAAARRDVEDSRIGPETEPLAEEDELLARGRILQLVERLGDDEVAGDHGRII